MTQVPRPTHSRTTPGVPVLSARALRHTVRLGDGAALDVLRDVDLDVGDGESVAVVGRSGSGKTTLLSLLGLMARPTHGTVHLRGTDTGSLSDAQLADLRSQHLGFVFQGYSLVPHLNAEQNVALPFQYGRALPRRIVRDRVRAVLDSVDLAGMGRRHPRHLSGGEQQRVAIARALVRGPQVLLADEPTGALDVETGEQVLQLLRTATRRRGCGLVLVTHDQTVAATLDRSVGLVAGRLHLPDALDVTDA